MHRQTSVLVLFTAIALAGCSTDTVAPIKAPPAPRLALATGGSSGSYIVLFKGNGIPTGFADRVASLGGTVAYANARAGFASVAGVSDASAVQLGALSGVSEVQADAVVALDDNLATARADVTDVPNPTIDSQSNPAAALLAFWQWNMILIKADKAWAARKLGSPNVTVAILDTGIDYDSFDEIGLVDLGRSVSFMSTYIPATATSAVHPADDTVAKKFFPSRNVITDFNGHGTNVAQQVSSKAFALAGVTSRTTLIGVKVLGSNGVGSFGQILSGVLWAADHGADVANMSLGGAFSKAGNGRLVGAINKVFNYAKQQGMMIVVAAGNDGADLQHNGNGYASFCDSPHVVCVSAVGPVTALLNPDQPAFYSNFGRQVISVAGPGGSADVSSGDGSVAHPFPHSPRPWGSDFASWVWSFCAKQTLAGFTAAQVPVLAGCQSGGFLTGFIGTSQASPHVAGLAALLIAEFGKGNPNQIKQRMQKTGDPINPAYGSGRINVKNALGL
jgi:lantibiotic leader peptide-processing serine protease